MTQKEVVRVYIVALLCSVKLSEPNVHFPACMHPGHTVCTFFIQALSFSSKGNKFCLDEKTLYGIPKISGCV